MQEKFATDYTDFHRQAFSAAKKRAIIKIFPSFQRLNSAD